jgi:small-conductance mechanosensitive channel
MLAGLGVGGIAVALAAQKTLENVIGGTSIIFDGAVRVGDLLKVGETLGTVQDIGLRSTRLRTFDRTVFTVPNGQIANVSLENLSLRDSFWFHHILGLRYETTVGQMRSVMHRITGLLENYPLVHHFPAGPVFPARRLFSGPRNLRSPGRAGLGSLPRTPGTIAAADHGSDRDRERAASDPGANRLSGRHPRLRSILGARAV